VIEWHGTWIEAVAVALGAWMTYELARHELTTWWARRKWRKLARQVEEWRRSFA